jgi:hypothetical protein
MGFIEMFKSVFALAFPDVQITAIEINEGSIIVTIDVVAATPQTLISFVTQVTADNGTSPALTFVFNSMLLTPSNVTQDPDFIIQIPPDTTADATNHLVIILSSTIPIGVILLVGIAAAIVAYVCFRKQQAKKSLMIKVKPVDRENIEERYVTHKNKASADTISYQSSVDEHYVLPDKSKQHSAIYINPGAMDQYGDSPHLYQSLDDSSSVSSRTLSTSLSDQNDMDDAEQSLPNMVPSPEASRPGTGTSRPGTGTSRPGTGTSRPRTATTQQNQSNSPDKEEATMTVEDFEG